MDPITIIKQLVKLASAIHSLKRQVKSNQKQCERLLSRVNIILKTLQGLKEIPSSDHFRLALEQLHNTVIECFQFIDEFGQKTRFQQFRQANQFKTKLIAFNQRLVENLQLLDLGIMFNR